MPAGVVVGSSRKKPDGRVRHLRRIDREGRSRRHPVGRGEVGDGLQHVIRRAVRPVKDGLLTGWGDAQIGHLRERGVNAGQQRQHDA